MSDPDEPSDTSVDTTHAFEHTRLLPASNRVTPLDEREESFGPNIGTMF